ncbi:MAG TPA: protoporphyrinogen oxidase [Bryobacteraceae bacterium]|jgi:oxygen-dependent protoporphyrinogen oxidase|nr:protoporphyrinogen oxidase [Bryobacteraceae bacterium]
MTSKGRVLIVGGGVSGLATAYFLSKVGIRATIVEKSERLGGLIHTDRVEGCDLEAGPDSYVAAKPAVTELAKELGIGDRIIGSNDAERRIFIVRNGKLQLFPRGMVMMAPAEWGPVVRSSLFSVSTKMQFVREWFSRPRQREGDVSIEEFVSDHFGREVLDLVTEPLLAGVYGGEAGRLSAQSVLPRFVQYEGEYGSLIRGVRKERKITNDGSLFLSFVGGMQTFSDALQSAIEPAPEVVRGEVSTLERQADSWRVLVGSDWITADEVVLACPAHASGRIANAIAPELGAELSAIPYSSAILVMLLFNGSQLEHALDGFGFLTPPSERKILAAATFVNTKFPSRIAPGFAALRGFLVGPQAETLMYVPDDDLLRVIREDFQRLMGITAAPVAHTIHRWPQSMPQYVVGHADRYRQIRRHLHDLAGLYVTSNAFEGVGIPDCVRLAKETANALASRREVR